MVNENNGQEAPWLDLDEQKAWRTYLFTTTRLKDRLSQALEQNPSIDLSLAEYEILVRLSESENESVRMSELAQQVVHSRSRLTHTVARMEKRGLVARERSVADGRGRIAVLTTAGRELLEKAAPIHVASVRELLLDRLGREDFLALARILDKLVSDEDRECIEFAAGE
ncbi:MarR family regulatory protein [Mycobacteroides abscessus subsp. abscessus]|nr:MarR family transcriptional regulator [Dermabacter sp. HSID17554]MCG7444410.1 MarR family transcriptional regulator [Dermabacter vaginalis]RUP86277.1 MarR family transcriptional regulator [Dermabacter sp. HSID17554]SHW82629.1 MarR family regulatory protein [Mycobacteroides abscessus subsp. abscessus]